MRLRILSAVVALTALLQVTGCCCLRDRICARRAYWRNYGGGSCCCEPACCDSHYSPISNPPPLARPMGYTVEQPGR
jgi:hypothetical protein